MCRNSQLGLLTYDSVEEGSVRGRKTSRLSDQPRGWSANERTNRFSCVLMSKHFNLHGFLRSAPKGLLQAYCARHGILQGFKWGTGKNVDAEAVVEAMHSAGDEMFKRAVAEFRVIWELRGQGFTRGVLNEARYHGDQTAYETLSKLTHLGKAFWTTLERPAWVSNAKILSDVDKLPPGAWIKRGGLPQRAGRVDQSTVEQLQDSLIEFFSKTEHRGFNCKIDSLQRGDEEIFFTYAEDHPDIDLFWLDGQLEPQVLNPSFKLIFKHKDVQRTLEIYIEGNRNVVPDLQQIFARTVIGEEILREARAIEPIYDLDLLLEPGFQFQHSVDLGIADIRVTKMRFHLDGEPWRRFTAEADNFKKRDALENFIAALTNRLPKSRLVLDQVCGNVLFHKREGDRRAPSRTFYITYPNSIRLKMDDLGEKITDMLLQSEIERSMDDDEP